MPIRERSYLFEKFPIGEVYSFKVDSPVFEANRFTWLGEIFGGQERILKKAIVVDEHEIRTIWLERNSTGGLREVIQTMWGNTINEELLEKLDRKNGLLTYKIRWEAE